MSEQIEEVMALVNALWKSSESRDDFRTQVAAHNAIEAKLLELLPEWHPIETAPKDGERFLGACKDGVKEATYYSKYSGDWEYGCCNMNWYPTHWMPLPKDPT